MANKVNNWKELLKLANEDVKKYNAKIEVINEHGDFSVIITQDGVKHDFAYGFYEDEISECINDAWANVRVTHRLDERLEALNKMIPPQMAYRVTAYYDVELGCEPEILIEIYATEKLAKQRVAQLIKKWKDGWKRTEEDADDWTEKEDSIEAYKNGEWNVDIFWMPEPIRNKID